ncbi:MAG: 4'-phosphopantetheinyl transferase superfamily protein [Candidatus Limnocylindria bacterium]
MLGNDVVDLGDPETRAARHPRFDARVFTREERAALARAADPERLRWSLWAAKEAAYKCLKKLEPGTCFSPVRFAVRLAPDQQTGSVEIGGRRLRVALFSQGDALHAVATDAGDPARSVLRVVSERPAGEDPAGDSRAVRALARDAAAALVGCAAGELAFAREGRAPRLLRGGQPQRLDLSLSHHGRFRAAALETRPGPGAV